VADTACYYTSYPQTVNRRKVGGRERRANERPVRRCGFVRFFESTWNLMWRLRTPTTDAHNINSHLDHHAPISPPRSHPLSVIYCAESHATLLPRTTQMPSSSFSIQLQKPRALRYVLKDINDLSLG
jgi:hypothetical protein